MVPSAFDRFLITIAWLLVSALPSIALVAFDVSLRSSSGVHADIVILPMLWLTCAALSSPIYHWLLGYVDEVEPFLEAAAPPLDHLPRECVRMVHEAMSIRANVDETQDALLRAWRLAQDLEQAAPDIREFVAGCGASLEPVHQLLASAEAGRPNRRSLRPSQLRVRLAAELAAFERALRYPRAQSYR